MERDMQTDRRVDDGDKSTKENSVFTLSGHCVSYGAKILLQQVEKITYCVRIRHCLLQELSLSTIDPENENVKCFVLDNLHSFRIKIIPSILSIILLAIVYNIGPLNFTVSRAYGRHHVPLQPPPVVQ